MEGDQGEAEQRARAREERRRIVERYDQGREDGAVIDDWEDPKFEIYHTQDRYGFIHDQRRPDDVGRSVREQKQLDKEMSRLDKWLKMLSESNKWFPEGAKYHEKMTERVWKGVPERLRGTLWHILLNIDRIKQEQEGKYQEMRDIARLHSPDIRQIDLDVNRTYRDHIMFRERYNSRQQDLFHVLAAYSMYNSEVGYCQGMSQIAALLLMYLNSDEDAFWALSQLMVGPKYNMHGFFIPGFPKLMRFQDHHDKILLKKLKRLQKHLMANNMDTGIYTLKWFFQCFLDRIPFSITIRVWDLYLLEGDTIMIAMAYTILKLHRKPLLKMEMDELMEFLQKTLETDFGYEDDFVIETALKDSLADLRSSKLHTAGSPPESEKPQRPFGLLLNIPVEETTAPVGKRLPVMDEERQFQRNTLQREEENFRKLQHLDSQTSIDEGSINLSLNETGSIEVTKSDMQDGDLSLDTIDSNHTPTSDMERTRQPISPLPSRDQDELDDSLMYMMKQASIDEPKITAYSKSQREKKRQQIPEKDDLDIRGAKMLHSEFKKGDQRRLKEIRRPASADPGDQMKKQIREEEKRMSVHANITDFGDRVMNSNQSINKSSSQSKSRSSSQHRQSSRDTTRFSGTSSGLDTSGSSRVLNISSDSFTDDHKRSSSRQSQHNSSRELREKTRAEIHAQSSQRGHQHSRSEPPEFLQKHTHSRPSSKSSYYFGEAPDLEEILSNLNGHGGAIEGDDVSTPMNDPMPSDIPHQTDCYLFHHGTPTNALMQDVNSAAPNVDEVVRIKVPFSEPYEPLEPLLTAQHNMERLAAQQINPQYNGHKVTIQVNRGNQDEGRMVHANQMLSPTERSSFNFNVRKVGSQQVTKRHITTTEKKISSSGSHHTSTHSMYVAEHSERANPAGRAPLASFQEMQDNIESKHFSHHSANVSRRLSSRSREDLTERSKNGSRNGSRNRSRDFHPETHEQEHQLHNESYSSNDGEVWESRNRSNSKNPRNDSRDNKMSILRKETFF